MDVSLLSSPASLDSSLPEVAPAGAIKENEGTAKELRFAVWMLPLSYDASCTPKKPTRAPPRETNNLPFQFAFDLAKHQNEIYGHLGQYKRAVVIKVGQNNGRYGVTTVCLYASPKSNGLNVLHGVKKRGLPIQDAIEEANALNRLTFSLAHKPRVWATVIYLEDDMPTIVDDMVVGEAVPA